MAFTDHTEYPRGRAHAVDVFNAPLVVAPLGTTIKVASIVIGNRSGGSRLVTFSNGDGSVVYWEMSLLIGTSFRMAGGFQLTDGLHVKASGSAVDVTVTYFEA